MDTKYKELKERFPDAKNKHALIAMMEVFIRTDIDVHTKEAVINSVAESMDFAFENGWRQGWHQAKLDSGEEG